MSSSLPQKGHRERNSMWENGIRFVESLFGTRRATTAVIDETHLQKYGYGSMRVSPLKESQVNYHSQAKKERGKLHVFTRVSSHHYETAILSIKTLEVEGIKRAAAETSGSSSYPMCILTERDETDGFDMMWNREGEGGPVNSRIKTGKPTAFSHQSAKWTDVDQRLYVHRDCRAVDGNMTHRMVEVKLYDVFFGGAEERVAKNVRNSTPIVMSHRERKQRSFQKLPSHSSTCL